MSRAVSRWAPIAARASRRYHIPVSVLLGEIQIESGGREGLTSSAQAKGLTQFIPGTARAYHVNTSPGHAKSQIFGQAHYLHDLERQHGGSLRAALQAYSGGSSSYPGMVLSAARGYKGVARRANRRAGVSGGSRGTPGTPGFVVGNSTVTASSHAIPQAATNLTALLSQPSQPTPAYASAPPEPAFSAHNRLALPQGYGAAIQNPVAIPQKASLADQLKQIQSLAGPTIQNPSVKVSSSAIGVPGTPGSPATGGGGNPHRAVTGGVIHRKHLGRTDQGVDFTGSGRVPAPGAGTITRVVPRGGPSGWPGGGFVVIKLDHPPDRHHRYVYLAENITPRVRAGQRVNAGQTIAHAHGSYPFLEYGWAADSHGTTLAHATTGYTEGQRTRAGKSFLRWLGV
jgi:hypothetical protein